MIDKKPLNNLPCPPEPINYLNKDKPRSFCDALAVALGILLHIVLWIFLLRGFK